jgi:hypothetical protein
MDMKDLISIYDNRWKQIQHLNELDVRSLVLAVTGLTGAVVSTKSSPNNSISPLLEAGLACLAAIVCAGGTYSAIRNRLGMEHAIAAIDFVETELNRELPGIFRFAGNYRAPSTMSKFFWRVFWSIRGPMILFFFAALVASVAIFAHGTYGVFGRPPYGLALSVSGGIIVSVFVTWLSVRRAWRDFPKLQVKVGTGNKSPSAD